ncbi:MAG TPA: hypothetical protein VGD52_20055 [Pseudoduganella sp.]
MPNRVLCAAFAFALPLCCAASEPDRWITTDRPDFVDAPEVVGKGHIQLETGVLQSKEARSTPTLLRIGVADALELRLETDGCLTDRSDLARTRGWGDAAMSFKWQTHEGEGGSPRVRDGGSTASFDFGGGYSFRRDLHLDAGAMLGLNHRTPAPAFTVGLSVRL